MNKYKKWYTELISRAKDRELDCYYEKHHIKPRALGGTNKKSNIVKLTYREHFLAHWLLTKFTKGEAKRSMCLALHRLCHSTNNGKKIISSWQYDLARRLRQNAMKGNILAKGNKHTAKHKNKIKLIMINIKRTNKWKKNISLGMKGNTNAKGHKNAQGMKHSDEFKKRMSERMRGTKHSDEFKKMMSEKMKGNQYWKFRSVA